MPVRSKGFSLLEVAIAIAVVAILAGTAIPLVVKSVNQAKEQRARQELRLLYEACFGSSERGTPGMSGDFGFPNGSSTPNLALTTQSLGTRLYGTYMNSLLLGGWRGSYWSGNTSSTGLPMDPWNQPYSIVSLAGGKWRVTSPGYGGTTFMYPDPGLPAPTGSLTVQVYRLGYYPVTATSVVATTPSNNDTLVSTDLPLQSGKTNIYRTDSMAPLPAGPVEVTVQIPAQTAVSAASLDDQPLPQTQTRVITVVPGSSQTIYFTFN